jgi:hypothetical protein
MYMFLDIALVRIRIGTPRPMEVAAGTGTQV